jgi:hypothetical protein
VQLPVLGKHKHYPQYAAGFVAQFIDEKPSFYNFSNETTNMTGAEFFAMFAPPTA